MYKRRILGMLYPELSKLNGILSLDKIHIFDNWLQCLTPNTYDKITVSKVSMALCIDTKTASKVLMKCVDEGIMKLKLEILCPECGQPLKIIEPENFSESESIKYCYACEENISISSDDIGAIFTFQPFQVNNSPFVNGQCYDKKGDISDGLKRSALAKHDTFLNLIENGFKVNNIIYKPTEEQYTIMKNMYSQVFSIHTTTTEIGNSLEDLMLYIFNLCKGFKADSTKTSTNQLDCFVRNQYSLLVPVLKEIGTYFVVECKNEKNTPKGTYMNKIHDIISLSNGKENYIKFGIIVSVCKPPKTYITLANKYYLKENVAIISIDDDDLKSIIFNEINLLEMIERKICEIKMDSVSLMNIFAG